MSPRTLERHERDDATVVDPRIAARRDAVLADGRRRRRRRLLAVLVVLTVLAGAWFLTRTSLLDVETVEVRGAVRTSPDDVRSASGVSPGDQLVDVDGATVARRVEGLPWVADASVGRSLDGTVVVTVTERAPAATVPSPDGTVAVVDAGGRVLEVVGPDAQAALDPALLPLLGVTAPAPGQDLDPVAAPALEVVARLTPGLRNRVSAVAVTPAGGLQLHLRPQGNVDLGAPTQLDAKLASLVTVLGQVDQAHLCTVGLGVPDLPTVTRC